MPCCIGEISLFGLEVMYAYASPIIIETIKIGREYVLFLDFITKFIPFD